MKTPTQYGSENEETSFIRRIAAPDRAHGKRKQKKRMAVVGATVGLIAASAMVGYAAMNQGAATESAVPTEQLDAKAQAVHEYVSRPDESHYPPLADLDTNKNNVLDQNEYLVYLKRVFEEDVAKVEAARLPREVKDSLISQIQENFNTDADCFVRAFKAARKNKVTIRASNLRTFYHTLDEFCPTNAVEVTQELLDKYAPTPEPTPAPTEPPTEAPTEPPYVPTEATKYETEAPYQPTEEPRTEAPYVPTEEPRTEAPYYPTEEPPTEAPYYPTEEPRTEAPYYPTEEPRTEAPYVPTEEPHTESPYVPTEEPQTEAPYVPTEEPQTEAPYYPTEEPQTESPYVPTEEPQTEAPYVPTEEPQTEAPYYPTEEPQTESPYVPTEEPVTDEPWTPTDPTIEPDVTEEPKYPVDETAEPTYTPSSTEEPQPDTPSIQPTEGPSGGHNTYDVIKGLGGYDDDDEPIPQPPAYETEAPSTDAPGQQTEAPYGTPTDEPSPTEPETESPSNDQQWMTKEEFRQKLSDHFSTESQYLKDVAEKADEEYKQLSAKIKRMDDCIERAANKFGWYGVYEQAPHYVNAIDWVANVCMKEEN